jgi:hypothetical protein
MLLVEEDGREEVESGEWPWSAVGYLTVNRTRGCTAALIGPRALITAGHCVYDTLQRAFVDPATMAFFPNMHGGVFPGGEAAAGVAWLMTLYNNAAPPVPCGTPEQAPQSQPEGGCQTQQDEQYDYAVVVLDRDLGSEYGWLGYGFSCEFQQYRYG